MLEVDALDIAQATGGMAVMGYVADMASVQAGVVAVEVACGGMDILVNNAGNFNLASIDRITPEDCRRPYDVNVGGMIFAYQAVIPSMMKRGGAINGLAGQAACRGEPNITICCSTKAAASSITRSLALELAGANIRVNGIAPGVMDAPMRNVVDDRLAEYENRPKGRKKRGVGEAVPMGRTGAPADVAGPCAFLALADSRYIAGPTLNVDGGNRMN